MKSSIATTRGEKPRVDAFSARSRAICVLASPPYRMKNRESESVGGAGEAAFDPAFSVGVFSGTRRSPVTAPDLRILAMSAALPVSGAGAAASEAGALARAAGGVGDAPLAAAAGAARAATDATDVPSDAALAAFAPARASDGAAPDPRVTT